MKHFILILLLMLFNSQLNAQDTIVKMNNKRVYGDVIEITNAFIRYVHPKKLILKEIRIKNVDYIIYSNSQIERFPKHYPPLHPKSRANIKE